MNSETASWGDPGGSQAPHDARGGEVLIVDDCREVGQLLCQLMSVLGHSAMACDSVAAAKRLIDARPLKGVVADFQMPGEGGAELYGWLEANHPALARRFVLMSADLQATETQEFLSRHAARVLAKPFRIGDVSALLEELQA